MDYLRALESINKQISNLHPIKVYGEILSIKGTIIEASGIAEFVRIGSMCKINSDQGSMYTEVVGFDHNSALLMPYEDLEGVSLDSMVELVDSKSSVYPDLSWRGRIIDAFANPMDTKGPLDNGPEAYLLRGNPIQTHKRSPVGSKINLGVKSIDTFVSCCYGQRMGIFAGSGVGKSVLISMLTKHANTDIKIIGLIGERSREVHEFVHEYLGPEGLKDAILIVSTGDQSPLMRKRATYLTLTLSEYFRDQGFQVLCIIDSITRFAMAQRQIGLSIGEPPTNKGYTPSVFSELPKLLERAGPGIGKYSITGLFTVLVEGDDHNEPVSDTVRGILDGHIVLDREIAERGRFPAVNILKSVSRTIPKCNNELENQLFSKGKRVLSLYEDMKEMIRIGAYKTGTNPEVDQAIKCSSELEKFFTQNPGEYSESSSSYKILQEILEKVE